MTNPLEDQGNGVASGEAGLAMNQAPTGLGHSVAIPNAKRERRVFFGMKMPAKLHDSIGKAAKRQGRSMSAEIIHRLEYLYHPAQAMAARSDATGTGEGNSAARRVRP